MERAEFLRSPWSRLIFALGLLSCLTGLAGATREDTDAAGDWIMVAVFLVPGGWALVTAPFAGVRVDGGGLRYRGMLRWTALPWSEIESVEAEVVGGNSLVAEAPCVRTGGGRTLSLTVLAGYQGMRTEANSRVRAQVLTVRRMRASALARGATES
ncbi:hypothetical protein ACI2LJ_19480 [Streptomyces sp. NPDC088090]|uniref:hypothetical protein n=1 Tax=Streptomyces sp. NPDC088090 TaxID=3365822 RepID=UPI00384E6D1F